MALVQSLYNKQFSFTAPVRYIQIAFKSEQSGFSIVTRILLHIIIEMRNNAQTKKIKYTTIIALILLYVIILFFRTIFNVDFNMNGLGCRIWLDISKYAMYFLLTYPRKLIFGTYICTVSHQIHNYCIIHCIV